jgi:holo-[acyl-carrier protein] synthase
MIVGIGLDVVELGRMENLLAGSSKIRFVTRVLTEKEYAAWQLLAPRRALEYIGGRFAAKEAVVKALGCGIGSIVGFQDIEVLPDEQGKPLCTLSIAAIRRLGWENENFQLHLAITHERKLAAATALVEKV